MIGSVPPLSFLAPEQAALVDDALAAIRRGLGEKLRSVSLVGTAVPPARHEGSHVLALLVVVSDLPVAALSNLGHQLRGDLHPGLIVRLLTERELLRSTDVFTLELAEYQVRHVVLAGEDPLEELHYTRSDLRDSIEHGLGTEMLSDAGHAQENHVSDSRSLGPTIFSMLPCRRAS